MQRIRPVRPSLTVIFYPAILCFSVRRAWPSVLSQIADRCMLDRDRSPPKSHFNPLAGLPLAQHAATVEDDEAVFGGATGRGFIMRRRVCVW